MSEPQAHASARRRPDWAALVIAAGLGLLGVIVAWDASRLGTGGSYARIGPQTIPYVIAIGLGGLAVWTAIEAWRGDFPERDRQEFAPVAWIVGGLLAQLVLIRFVGFSLATGLLFAMTARGLGKVRLPLALLVGVLLSAAVWYVFARLLQLNLPAGPPERLLLDLLAMLSPPRTVAGAS
ncbi:tripartite tricarboxylate transporter TctB family protein [Devosia sp.]|uniref:tripartite tricarboxylate transporter TctB family protein n=1 Tax=Devosia sp. TaxID=1871048 RepID=UPI0035AEF4E6